MIEIDTPITDMAYLLVGDKEVSDFLKEILGNKFENHELLNE